MIIYALLPLAFLLTAARATTSTNVEKRGYTIQGQGLAHKYTFPNHNNRGGTRCGMTNVEPNTHNYVAVNDLFAAKLPNNGCNKCISVQLPGLPESTQYARIIDYCPQTCQENDKRSDIYVSPKVFYTFPESASNTNDDPYYVYYQYEPTAQC